MRIFAHTMDKSAEFYTEVFQSFEMKCFRSASAVTQKVAFRITWPITTHNTLAIWNTCVLEQEGGHTMDAAR